MIVSVLLVSSFITYISFHNDLSQSQPTTSTLPQTLGINIEPSDPIQLKLNQTQVFIANMTKQDTKLEYIWSVDDSSSNVAINGTNYLLLTCGNQAIFKFLDNNLDFCWLNVEANSSLFKSKATVTIQYFTPAQTNVSDQQGNSQENQRPSQNQNYFTTNVYDIVASAASFIVKTDGKGLFEAINGTDGKTIDDYTSTIANTTVNKAIAAGGIIAIRTGDYTGAELIVPYNANVIAEPGVTGIKYQSIADGARIDEPTFNAAFGGYISGSYTIATNRTSFATSATWYLAFKPDKTIFLASTDDSDVFFRTITTSQHVYVGSGDYYGALLSIPPYFFLELAPDAVNISYSSIGNGARIIGGDFNKQFGCFCYGAYTITTNGTLYIALKSDNSIYFPSIDASMTINNVESVISRGQTVFLTSNVYRIHSPLRIANDSTLLGPKGNSFFGANIVATQPMASMIDAHNTFGGTLKGLWLEGNGSQVNGIDATLTSSNSQAAGTIIDDVTVARCNGTGILLSYNQAATLQNQVTVFACNVGINATCSPSNMYFNAVNLWGNSVADLVIGDLFENGGFYGITIKQSGFGVNSGIHIQIQGVVNTLLIDSCWFEGGGTAMMLDYKGSPQSLGTVEITNSQFYINATSKFIQCSYIYPLYLQMSTCDLSFLNGYGTMYYGVSHPNSVSYQNCKFDKINGDSSSIVGFSISKWTNVEINRSLIPDVK
jgi:hypothetical protein